VRGTREVKNWHAPMHANAIKTVQARMPRPTHRDAIHVATFSSSSGLAHRCGQALSRSVRAATLTRRRFPWQHSGLSRAAARGSLAFATQRGGFKKGAERTPRRPSVSSHTRMTLQLVSSLPTRCSRLAVPRLRRYRILLLRSSCPESDSFSFEVRSTFV
jgi:hypothetical protein